MLVQKELGAAFHSYQPPREVALPLGGRLRVVPEINEKIFHQTYERILTEGLLDGVVYSVFASLRSWMKIYQPEAMKSLRRGLARLPDADYRIIGDPLFHVILPFLAYDETKILFEAGRMAMREDLGVSPVAVWLPECGVDVKTAQAALDVGYQAIVLKDSQLEKVDGDPMMVRLDRGEIMVWTSNAWLSNKVANDPTMTVDSWRFLEMIADWGGDGSFLAVDTETFGHHWYKRDEFAKWVFNREKMVKKGLVPMDFRAKMGKQKGLTRIREGTSWSCVHGLERWTGGCDCDNASAKARGQKREYFGGLMDRRLAIVSGLDRSAPGWKDWMPAFLAANRHYLFGENKTNLAEGLDGAGRVRKLMEAYQMCLIGMTSCGWFFGTDGSEERAYPQTAIEEIDKLGVV